MNNKGLSGAYIFLVIIGLIVVAILFFKISPSITGNVVSSPNIPNKVCKEVQVPYENTEYYSETEPYSDRVCDYKEIAYNIGDITKYRDTCVKTEDKCLKYILGICSQKETYCVDKQIGCTVIINNVDNEKGYWSFDFVIREQGSGNVVDTRGRGATILAQDSQTFQTSGEFTGREKADKSYYCTLLNMNAPQKENCQYITKYRDVQKSRTVTKYRTEKQCS